jgi:hypothetical protein
LPPTACVDGDVAEAFPAATVGLPFSGAPGVSTYRGSSGREWWHARPFNQHLQWSRRERPHRWRSRPLRWCRDRPQSPSHVASAGLMMRALAAALHCGAPYLGNPWPSFGYSTSSLGNSPLQVAVTNSSSDWHLGHGWLPCTAGARLVAQPRERAAAATVRGNSRERSGNDVDP